MVSTDNSITELWKVNVNFVITFLTLTKTEKSDFLIRILATVFAFPTGFPIRIPIQLLEGKLACFSRQERCQQSRLQIFTFETGTQ